MAAGGRGEVCRRAGRFFCFGCDVYETSIGFLDSVNPSDGGSAGSHVSMNSKFMSLMKTSDGGAPESSLARTCSSGAPPSRSGFIDACWNDPGGGRAKEEEGK